MTTLLLYSDALNHPEMRHEIGEPVMDELAFIEHDGKRIVVGSVLEETTFAAREDVVDEYWTFPSLGSDELIEDKSFPEHLIDPELVYRALKRAGAERVCVPSTSGVLVADYLRERGVEVMIDEEVWTARRRRKTPWELEGIERAQRAAETAMLTAARMLREAEPMAGGFLRFEGETLTAEWIREVMTSELSSQGTDCEQILVQSGDAALNGHNLGFGPILPDESCVIDVFPRDRRTGAYSDMTRTFVPGAAPDEIERLHKHCKTALEIAFESLQPGRNDAYARVVEYFHAQGFPTQDHRPPNEVLREGFFHSLGHGVGLQVHEKPGMGRRADPLVAGDVVAVEPGLYFYGVGGVRLEDTVVVTEEGAEPFTDPYPYELQP